MEVNKLHCFFCYKQCDLRLTSDSENLSVERRKKVEQLLKLFDKNICLKSKFNLNNATVSEALTSCNDCLLLVTSLNELHCQLKLIQMKIGWRMSNLRNIMSQADRIPSRVKEFQELMEVQSGIGREETMELRKNVVKKLSSQRRKFLPRVVLERWIPNASSYVDAVTDAVAGEHLEENTEDLVNVPTTNSFTNDMEIGKVEDFTDICNPEVASSKNSILLKRPLCPMETLETSNNNVSTDLDTMPNLKEERDSILRNVLSSSTTSGNCDIASEPEVLSSRILEMPNLKMEVEPEPLSSSLPTEMEVYSITTEVTENISDKVNPETMAISVPNPNQNEDTSLAPEIKRLRSILKCSVCKRMFSTKARLEIHMKSHDSDDECISSSSSSEDDVAEASKKKMRVHRQVRNQAGNQKDCSDFEEELSDSSHSSGSDSKKLAPPFQEKPALPVRVKVEPVQKRPLRRYKCDVENCTRSLRTYGELMRHKWRGHQHKNSKSYPIPEVGCTIGTWISKKGAKFHCPQPTCKRACTTKSELEDHSKLHARFYCKFCSIYKDWAEDLATHEQEHFQNKKKCPRCLFEIKNPDGYIEHHLNRHLGVIKDAVRCPLCKLVCYCKDFESNCNSMLRHIFNEHCERPEEDVECQKCPHCEVKFYSVYRLDRHIVDFHISGERRYDCKICGKSFKKRRFLRLHCSSLHEDFVKEFKFTCAVKGCDQKLETEVELVSHMQHIHKEGKYNVHICPHCGKKCVGEVPFKCHLKVHKPGNQKTKRRKVNKSNYFCEQCGKGFLCKYRLELHYLSHSGPESWQFCCSVCGKKCMTQQKLDEHARTHTKEKPFVCQECGETYAHRHNLRNHLKTKHGL